VVTPPFRAAHQGSETAELVSRQHQRRGFSELAIGLPVGIASNAGPWMVARDLVLLQHRRVRCGQMQTGMQNEYRTCCRYSIEHETIKAGLAPKVDRIKPSNHQTLGRLVERFL
jgi:hypothetical protein